MGRAATVVGAQKVEREGQVDRVPTALAIKAAQGSVDKADPEDREALEWMEPTEVKEAAVTRAAVSP